jgi:hypothetical protein
MRKQDKNGVELNLNDEVKFNDIQFRITEFKVRSTGYVVYNEGLSYNVKDLIKVEPEEPAKDDTFKIPKTFNPNY